MSKILDVANQIDYINSRFSEGARLTVQEIHNELVNQGFTHVSIKTLYRRLATMREKGEYASDSEGRWFSKSGQTVLLPSFITSSENVKYINIIKNLVDSLQGTPVYEKASRLFGEIARVSPAEKNYGSAKLDSPSASSRIIFLGAPANNTRDSVWREIFEAMEKNQYISFEYTKPGSSNSFSISVMPLQLIFDNGIWDLWANECKSRKNHLYNLARISRITVKQETFILPDDFDFHNETTGSFGCYRDVEGTGPGKTKYSIWLKNGTYAQTFAKERFWGPDQSFEDKGDGGIVLSFTGNQYRPILRWILGWGSEAQPVEPDCLVEDWKNQIKEMSALVE